MRISDWSSDVCSSDLADIEMNDQQKAALYLVLQHPVSALTGGPGVGKSTVTKQVISAFRLLDPAGIIALSAPTGRAAKRSEEHTSELQSLMRISYAVFCLKKK